MSRPQRITTQIVEKNIQHARDLDVYRAQLHQFSAENAKLLSAANAQSRVDASRKSNYQNMCQKEKEFEVRIREEQKLQMRQKREADQNAALALQLDRETSDRERMERDIQRIAEESPELKELQKALKIAYLNKERAAQHMDKVARENLEKEREQAIEDKLEHDRQMEAKREAEKKASGDDMFADTRVILQRQLKEREDLLLETKRQVMIDRETVDATVRRIQEEDRKAYEDKKLKQVETEAMMRSFAQQREDEKRRAREAERAEEEAIAAYNKSLEARGAGEAKKKADKQADADRKLAAIVAETERKRKEEEEFNNLRDMLWEEELEHARMADDKARKERLSLLTQAAWGNIKTQLDDEKAKVALQEQKI